MVRDAIYRAARYCRDEGRDCMTQDMREVLYAISRDLDIPPRSGSAVLRHELGHRGGCEGFDGEVCHRPGSA